MRLILTFLVLCLTLLPMATEAQVLLPKNKDSGFMGLLPDFMKPKPEPQPTSKKNITPRRVAPPVAPQKAIAPTLPTVSINNNPTYQKPPTMPSFPMTNPMGNASGNFMERFDSLIPKELMNSLPKGFDKIMKQQMSVIQKQVNSQKQGSSGLNFGLNQTSQAPISITPGGIVAPELMQYENDLADAIKHASPKTLKIANRMKKLSDEFERNKLSKRNPQQILMPDILLATDNSKNLKNTMSFISDPNYLWGKRDLQMINQSLGYKKIDVPKNCQVRHVLTINTNDPQAPNNNGVLWGGKTTALRYNGAVQSAQFKSMAVCYKPKEKPKYSSIVTQVGDKMGIALPGHGECTPPKSLSYINRLHTKYIGDGNIECRFE